MDKKKISLMEFEGNPNIGIYMFANDKFCLIGLDIAKEKQKEIEKCLNVPVYKTTILNTQLIGIFACGNNDFLIVPQTYTNEEKNLKEICEKHKTKLIIAKEILNTFGNNICMSQNKIITNDKYSNSFLEQLQKETKYKIIKIQNPNFDAIGSTFKFLNNKFFISQEYTKEQIKTISKEIGGIGTINKGNYFIASGIIGNIYGLIIGTQSSTVEIQNIVESLDYI